MRKSTLIAQCLVKAGVTLSIMSGEREVERVFRSEFGDEDFDWWNSHIGTKLANDFARDIGPATRVHVDKLIESLWANH